MHIHDRLSSIRILEYDVSEGSRWGDSPFDPWWRRYPYEAASDTDRWIPAYSPASSTADRHHVGADASICAIYRKVERTGGRSRQFTDHCLVSPYYAIQRLMPKLIIEPIIEMMRNAVSGEQMKTMVIECARLGNYSVSLAFHGLELEVVVVEIVVDGSLNDFSN